MVFDPSRGATALLLDRKNRMVVSPLPPGLAPTTEVEGAAIQHALARLVDADPPFGFKIGATGRRMQSYLGVDAPIGGFMQGKDVYLSHADLRFADYLNPGVECEVAVRLAADLPAGPCSQAQARAAVGDFVAAIEIVENRYGDLKELGTPTLVADQMYHAAAVVGDQGGVDWRSLDIGALPGRIEVKYEPGGAGQMAAGGGAPASAVSSSVDPGFVDPGFVDPGFVDQGVTTDLLGHPLTGLAWLAGSVVAKAFGGLKAGQIVMLGSITLPIWLSRPATVTVDFPPLPRVTLRLR